MRNLTRLVFGYAAFIALPGIAAAASGNCTQEFDSTFALIEKVIFEQRGCTSATCHSGTAPAGGLDLTPGVAYDNLIDQPAQTVSTDGYPGLARLVPGNKGRSLLWLNLASAVQPELWKAPLRSMPSGGLPPLTFDELELLRLWIEYGATRDGVVPGTGEAFDACLPPPKPLKVEPLAPPPPGLGVQLRGPRQVLPPQTERETCFVSYYDFTDQIPAEFLAGIHFRYKRVDARQDPLSHHAVVVRYRGSTPITSPVWGAFACRGGARDGETCDPTNVTGCGADSVCASEPVQALACIGFGPGDAGIGNGDQSLFSTMGAAVSGSSGIYEEMPPQGILVWNSHAFNITDEPATLDMWINFEFAAPAEQIVPLARFVDTSAIGKMRVPAFGADEVCQHYVAPRNARMLELASHTHKRGKRFRIFEGRFACDGGSKVGQPCTPFGREPGFPVAELCPDAQCTARMPPRVGDCNGDGDVHVDELITGVNIALVRTSISVCQRFDGDGDLTASVDELVSAVDAALRPQMRTAGDSLVYTSLSYADPLYLTYDPPKLLGGNYSTDVERTLTFCALYDNGFTNPDEVKRNSLVPSNGAPCAPTHCAEGLVGDPCQNDAQCDTTSGAGDGFCDACTVGFNVTTDDEMFVLAGSYIQYGFIQH